MEVGRSPDLVSVEIMAVCLSAQIRPSVYLAPARPLGRSITLGICARGLPRPLLTSTDKDLVPCGARSSDGAPVSGQALDRTLRRGETERLQRHSAHRSLLHTVARTSWSANRNGARHPDAD
jgi:hypothetical protein